MCCLSFCSEYSLLIGNITDDGANLARDKQNVSMASNEWQPLNLTPPRFLGGEGSANWWERTHYAKMNLQAPMPTPVTSARCKYHLNKVNILILKTSKMQWQQKQQFFVKFQIINATVSISCWCDAKSTKKTKEMWRIVSNMMGEKP